MDEILSNYAELDLRNLYERNTQYENVEMNPFNLADINSNYYDVNDILPDKFSHNNFQCKVLHLNIQGLSSKFDQVQTLLSELSDAHVETFVNDDNAHLFKLPNYNFIYKNIKIKAEGGVAIYIRDNIQYTLREDLSIFIEGEFESIYIESITNGQTSIVGEIYRIPNTNVNLSIQRYEAILHKTESSNSQVIIGTDQNFDYLKINSYKPSTDLLHLYLAANTIPTITKPTRITYTSATLIDNIYVRDTTPFVHSGILFSDISDHLPIFCLIGKRKPSKTRNEPLIFNVSIRHIKSALHQINWTHLHQLDINNAFKNFTEHLNCTIASNAPEKTVKIKSKYVIRNVWMTKGLMQSSITSNKLYRKYISKPKKHPAHIRYAKYRYIYNKVKQIAKTTYYANQLNTFKNDCKKTWNLLIKI